MIAWSAAEAAAPPEGKKIVFLWQQGHHPNEASCILFKHCLENSANMKGIRCEVYELWPDDPGSLDDAAAIVVYTEGSSVFAKDGKSREEALDRLMKKGGSMVVIHYGLFKRQFQNWIGAFYHHGKEGDPRKSVHQFVGKPITFTPAKGDHPILRGWKEFTLPKSESYHHLWFIEPDTTVPILTAKFGDVPHPGPKSDVTVWAWQRPDGGRGVGIGGGHSYFEWLDDDVRKMALNGIVWAAGIEVPKDGVESKVPDELRTERKSKKEKKQ
jgi:type 1 glutamine amidotransferase